MFFSRRGWFRKKSKTTSSQRRVRLGLERLEDRTLLNCDLVLLNPSLMQTLQILGSPLASQMCPDDSAPLGLSFSRAPGASIDVPGVTITGQVTGGTGGIQSLQAVVDGGTPSGVPFDSSGKFTFTVDLPQDGPHSIQFTATDKSGDTISKLVPAFVLDTVPPVITLSPSSPDSPAGPGGIAAGPLNQVPAISGRVTDASPSSGLQPLHAATDGHAPVTVPVDGSGNFVFTPAGLADGAHTVQFTVSDQAGNLAVPVSFSFTLDRVAPVIALSTPPPTHVLGQAPAIAGRVTDAAPSSGLQAVLASIDGTIPFAVTADASGNFTFTPPGLADGVHTVQFTASDQAGNAAAPRNFTFTLDAHGPVITVQAPPANGATTQAQVRGQVTDALAAVTSLQASVDGGQPVNVTFDGAGNFTFNPAGLADGSHTVTLQATDQAGAQASQSVTFFLDTVAPVVALTSTPPSGPVNHVPAITGQVTDANPSSGLQALQASIDGGAPAAVPLDNSGNFTLSPTGLADGSHTVAFQATDRAGNPSAGKSFSFTLDSVAPVIALSTTPPAGPVNHAPAIAGKVTDAAPSSGLQPLQAVIDGGTPVTVAVDGSGGFSFTPTGLADGAHTVQFQTSDKAGNPAAPKSFSFTLQTSAPAITFTPPAPTGPVNQVPNIGGHAPGAQSLQASIDGGTPVSVPLDGSGNFTFTLPGNLPDGTHTVQFQETDQLGNPGSSSFTFTLDRAAPAIVLTTTPPAGPVNHAPAIAGQVTDPAPSSGLQPLQARIDGGAAVTVPVNGSGTFSFTPTGLADGTHAVQFTVSDQAGNAAAPQSFTFTLDTTAPVITFSAPPPTGPVSQVPAITGQVSGAQSLTAAVDGGTPVGLTFDGSGNFSFNPPAGLADGAHAVLFQATDAAGNTGTKTFPFTLDTHGPAITIQTPAANAVVPQAQVKGQVAGPASPVTSLQAAVDGGQPVGVTFDGSGNFTFNPTGLADGSHTVAFRATDQAGATTSQSVTFVLDSHAPTITVTSPAANAAVSHITITGTVADPAPSSGLQALRAAVDGGAPVTVPVDGSGNFTFSPTGLADGTHTVQLRTADQAGNPATTSFTFTLDTAAPAIALSPSAPAGAVNQAPAITGKVTDAAPSSGLQALQAAVDGGTPVVVTPSAGGNFSFTPAGLADGTHTVQFTVADQAGNQAAPQTFSFTLDSVAPAISLSTPAPTTAVNHVPAIVGQVTDAAPSSGLQPLHAVIDGGAPVSVSVDGSGNFTFSPTGLADGAHTVQFQVADQAGNAATPRSFRFTLDATAPVITLTTSAPSSAVNQVPAIAGQVTDAAPSSGLQALQASIDGGTPVTVPVNGSGNFSFTATGVADGAHTIQFTVSDQAGNPAAAKSFRFTLDTAAPVITLTTTAPAGPVNQAPAIAGQVTDASPSSGIQSLQAVVDGGSPVAVTADNAGDFTFTPTGLADGSHTVKFQAADAAGNQAVARTFTFTLTTAAPVITFTPPAPTSPVKQVPAITGQVPGAQTLTAAVDGGPTVSVPLDGSGNFSYAPGAVPDGGHTVQFVATDPAGNHGTASFTFTLDTAAPVITLATAAPTGPVNHTPGITGQVTDAAPSSGLQTLQATVDGGTAVPVTVDGAGNFTFTPAGLADGTHTVQFRLADKAGNRAAPQSFAFTLDTAAPVITLSTAAPTAPVNLVPAVAGQVTDAAPGSGLQPLLAAIDGGAAVSVPVNNSGGFTFSPTGLADGAHTIQFTVSDQAGNQATPKTFTFTLDSAAPAITLSTTPPTGPVNRVPAIAGQVTDATPSSGLQPLQAAIDGGTPVAVSVDGSGNFTFTPSGLADGAHAVQFTLSDRAGNPAAPKSFSFTLDTTIPVITLSTAAPASPVSQVPAIAGQVTDAAPSSGLQALQATIDGGTPAVLTPDGAGHFSFSPTGLADGAHTVQFTVSDQAGNQAVPKTFTFALDTAAPVITLSTAAPEGPVNHAPAVAGQVTDASPSSGIQSLQASVDGGTPVTLTLNGTGGFSFNPTGLADGTHTFQFQASDRAGNQAAVKSFSFTLDSAAPVITLTTAAPAGPVNQLPTIAGQVTDAAPSSGLQVFQVSIDGGSPSAVTVGGGGAFSFTPAGLADGTHTLQFQAADRAGNQAAPQSFTFTLDTAAPTITLSAGPSGPVTHLSNFTGLVTDAAPSSGIQSLQAVVDGGAALGVLVNANGTFSFTPPSLAEGAHSVQFQVTDRAGNQATKTASFTLDTVPPVITLSTAAPNAPVNQPPAIAGLVTDPAGGSGVQSLQASIDGGSATAVAFDGNGAFTFTPAGLADGSHTVQFHAADAAGNQATVKSFTFTLDATAPVITLSTAVPTAPVNHVPAISGQVTDAAPSSGIQPLQVSIDGGAPATVAVSGNGTFTLNAPALTDGAHTIRFDVADRAGNQAVPRTFSFTLDTAAPVITLSTAGPAAPINRVPTIAGQVTDAAPSSGLQALTASVDGGPAAAVPLDPSGNFSVTPSNIADGSHTIRFQVSDAAGNPAAAQTFSFTLDRAAPVIALSTAAPSSPVNQVPTIHGNVSDPGPSSGIQDVQVSIDGGTPAGLPFDSSGNFGFTPAVLADGPHTVQFQAADKAGNAAVVKTFTFTLDTHGPVVTIDNPPPAAQTSTVPTITGTVADALSHVASLQERTDSGAAAGVTFDSFGGFSFRPNVSTDGPHTVVFQATDSAGNVTSQSLTFTLVTNAPAITVRTPFPNSATNQSQVQGQVTDAASPVASLQASLDGGQAVSLPFDASGDFTLTPTGLADGTHTLVLQATDQAGTTGSQTVTFVLDTQAPVIHVTSPAGNSFTNHATITGQVTDPAPGSGVEFFLAAVDSAGLAPVTPDGAGNFSFSPAGLADGAHTAHFQAVDQAGNLVTLDLPFTLDTAAPVIALSTPAPSNPVSQTPAIAGQVTDVAPSSGLQPLHAVVDGGTPVPVTVDGAGSFTFTPAGLADGTHTVQFTVADQAGNQAAPKSFSFTLDTAAPVISLSTPAPAGPLNSVPVIAGQVRDGAASSGLQPLQVSLDGGAPATVPVDVSGNFSFSPTGLADGAHTVQFQVADLAGNQAAPRTFAFTLDTATPVIALSTTPPAGPVVQVPTVTGQVTDAAPSSGLQPLHATLDGGAPVTVAVTSTGGFSFIPTGVPDGTHTIQFQVSDQAGNQAVVRSFTFTLDTTPPVITLTTTPPSLPVKTPPAIAGQVTDPAPGSGVKSLQASVDGGTPVAVTVSGTGAFSFTPTGLNDATHTVAFQATDQAGNPATPRTFTFTLNAHGPDISVSGTAVSPPVFAPQVTTAGLVTNHNVTVNGTANDPESGLASLQATVDGGPFVPVAFDATGAFSFTTNLPLDGSADGPHTITFKSTDQAGNVTTSTFDFVLDTNPPLLAITGVTV